MLQASSLDHGFAFTSNTDFAGNGVQRGDVVAIHRKGRNGIIKRIVALEGDDFFVDLPEPGKLRKCKYVKV